jgi:hypothetical protein
MMNRRSRSTTSLILELADDSSSTFSLVDEFRRRGAASKKRPLSLAQTSRTSAAASLRRRHEAQHREERQPPPPLLEPLEPMRWSSKVGSRAVRHEPREPQHFEHPTALASSALEVQAAIAPDDGSHDSGMMKKAYGDDKDNGCSSEYSEGSRLRASVDFGPMAPPSPGVSAKASIESSADTAWSHESDKYVRAANLTLVKFAPSVSAAGAALTLADTIAAKIRQAETRSFMMRKQRRDSKAVYTDGFGSAKMGQLPAVILAIEATVMKLVLLREQHLAELKRQLEAVDALRDANPAKGRLSDSRRARRAEAKGEKPAEDEGADVSIASRIDATVVALAQLRGASVEVVEAVTKWRRAAERRGTGAAIGIPSGRFFKWEGQNYLIKMMTDQDMLDQYTIIRDGLGFPAAKNPFLVPPESMRTRTNGMDGVLRRPQVGWR